MRHDPRARKRRCTWCGWVRLVEEFPPDNKNRDGRGSICRSCRRRSDRAYRRKNREHCRRLYRKQYQKRRRLGLEHRWLFPGMDAVFAKMKIRAAARSALRAGRLHRPDRCQACGEPAGPTLRIEMHHPDYARPLDVRFLCTFCHGREHQRFADDLPDPWENGLGETIAECELRIAD